MPETITPELREKILKRAAEAPKAEWIPVDEQDDEGEELGKCSVCGRKGPCLNFCGCGASFLNEREIAAQKLKGEDDDE